MSQGQRPRKYRRGRQLRTMAEVLEHIEAGGWFWIHHSGKAIHAKVFINRSLAMVLASFRFGGCWAAEITPEWQAAEDRRVHDLTQAEAEAA